MADYTPGPGPRAVPVIIADNATTSPEADLRDRVLCGVFLPAGFLGTSLTFLAAAATGGTFLTIQDGEGADYTVTVAASKFVPVDPTKFVGVRFLKVKSGSSETGGPLTLYLAVR